MLAGAAEHGYGAMDLFYFYKDADGPFPKNGFQHWRHLTARKTTGFWCSTPCHKDNNASEVLFRLCTNTDPQRDSRFTKGPTDVLDHATSEMAIGSKLGIEFECKT